MSKTQRDYLHHLLNARGQITDELSYFSHTVPVPTGISAMRSNTSHTSKPPKKLKITRGKAAPNQPLFDFDIPPQNIMVSYPFTSTISSNHRPAAPTDIKLPIFRLPTASASLLPKRTSSKDAVHTMKTNTTHNTNLIFMGYDNIENMHEALYALLQGLAEREKHILNNALQLTDHDLSDSEANLRHLIQGSDKTRPQSAKLINTMEDLLPVSMAGYFPISFDSIFTTARYVMINNINAQSELKNQHNPFQSGSMSEVLHDIDKEVDLLSIGFSPGLKDFLLSEKLKQLHADPMQGIVQTKLNSSSIYQSASNLAVLPYSQSNIGTGKKKNRDLMHTKNMRLKPLHHTSNSLSSSQFLTSPSSLQSLAVHNNKPPSSNLHGSSPDLTKELIDSLTIVQKHTVSLKRTLESAQSLISLHDSKARQLVNMIAAEKLCKGLRALLVADKKRGFIAWKLFIFQVNKAHRHRAIVTCLIYRNILVGLRKRLHKVLNRRVKLWKNYTVSEVQRLRRQKVMDSIVKIQSCMRMYLSSKRVKLFKQRRKYEKLYDSTIKIQALLRGKRIRWNYIRNMREKKEKATALAIQCNYRGYLGRKRAAWLRFRKNRHGAAASVQKIMRGYLSRKRVRKLRQDRMNKRAATKMQSILRGFMARKNIATLIVNRARYQYARKIQAMVRGALTRKNKAAKIKEIHEYREERAKAVRQIQSLYRGYRCRIIYRLMMFQWKQHRDKLHRAGTSINKIIRGFLARRYLAHLKKERRDHWIQLARQWQEMWSDESQTWYYFNASTQESMWEPTKQGYTKFDGKLVLMSGEMLDDPSVNLLSGRDDDSHNHGEEKVKTRKVNGTKLLLCTECNERVAIVSCEECGDVFCTKCYKFLHALGARRSHHNSPLGPKDCNECELLLAERYCVACDENFCDSCWRLLHSHGKRCFHPYSEISTDGRVDSRVFTMDGDQLSGAYDAAIYAQSRADTAQSSQMAMTIHDQITANSQLIERPMTYVSEGMGGYYGSDSQSLAQVDKNGFATGYYDGSSLESAAAGDEIWSQYYDEQGYPYYYNNITGESQYESPYG